MALDIERLRPLQAFVDDMDHLVDEVGRMKPVRDNDRTDLPGVPEWNKEKEYRKTGVPITAAVTNSLEQSMVQGLGQGRLTGVAMARKRNGWGETR